MFSSTSNLDQNESWEALHEAIKIGNSNIYTPKWKLYFIQIIFFIIPVIHQHWILTIWHNIKIETIPNVTGAERIVARLIRNGANVNAVNPNSNVPALILAIAEGICCKIFMRIKFFFEERSHICLFQGTTKLLSFSSKKVPMSMWWQMEVGSLVHHLD